MLGGIKVGAKWEGYAELPVWRAQHLLQLGDLAKKMCRANQKWQCWVVKKFFSETGMENANHLLCLALIH